jgi:hypothetical protein
MRDVDFQILYVSNCSHSTNHMTSKHLRVAVVSIGRSGTSLVARILDQVLGVDFGDEADHIPRNYNNPDGYFENASFLALDERVLQSAGAWVLTPPSLDYLESMSPSIRAAFEAEAASLLQRFAADKPSFGWKDPRLSFTLPVWRAACPEVVPIIAFRDPRAVLASIGAQLDRTPASMATLWLDYYRHVFIHTTGLRRHFVSFDGLLDEPTPLVLAMAAHLGIEISGAQVTQKLAEIIKPQQSQHSSAKNASNGASFLDVDTLTVYDYLLASTRDGGQPDRLVLQRLLAL